MEISQVIQNLELNNFEVYPVKDIKEARLCFMEIFDRLKPSSVSYGDSETFFETDLRSWLNEHATDYIDTFEKGIIFREKIRRMRLALTVDLFITGSNAITEKGQLVNLDMIGNRIGGINFGPKHVVLFVKTEKICTDLETAMDYIRNIVAPRNARRHDDIKTPCKVSGKCEDCGSPTRICNQWLITEKSHPKGRIKIILIDK
ncbi:lactate utilization protein [Acidaminobacter sp. JC074]|uniref:lactate utilization protein n=1 Tax=Acidaminobacter sp. JC074 TaxID=2530199 RepID=UPI001F0FC7FA|nr:lactate utilization protein [Acidaminobacter sp. JC074]MCH4889210.1 lactate utilization protein [Acidaminobacter sp. JC074]